MSLGRPRMLDDVKRGEICALLNAGLEFNEAARYVGCTPRTIRREIRCNADFRRAVHDALLAARLAPEKLLRQAAGRNWRAAAWLLERTDPHVYARRGPGGCTLDDLDGACRWIIDVAMHEVHHVKRESLFDQLTAIVQDVKTQILQRTNPRKPIRTPPADFYDLAFLVRKDSLSPLGGGDLSAGGENPADKSRSTSVSAVPGGDSSNAEAGRDAAGHKSGLLSAQTCFAREPKRAPPTETTPRRQAS